MEIRKNFLRGSKISDSDIIVINKEIEKVIKNNSDNETILKAKQYITDRGGMGGYFKTDMDSDLYKNIQELILKQKIDIKDGILTPEIVGKLVNNRKFTGSDMFNNINFNNINSSDLKLNLLWLNPLPINQVENTNIPHNLTI